MTPLSDLLARLAPSAPAGPSERPGALVMPAQSASTAELPANSAFSVPFSPGFEESPIWPVEAWQLASFQVALSGSLTVPVELQLTAENETLAVTLSLIHRGRAIWSQNLSLRLVPQLASANRVFLFSTTVFVDLTNPIRYEAGSQLQFAVSGIVPVYKPGPGFEAEVLSSLEAIDVTQAQALAILEAEGATQEAMLSELGAQGTTQEEMLARLEEIVEELAP